jgi:hypothetical protein
MSKFFNFVLKNKKWEWSKKLGLKNEKHFDLLKVPFYFDFCGLIESKPVFITTLDLETFVNNINSMKYWWFNNKINH